MDAKSKGYNGEYTQNDDVLLTPKFEFVGRMTFSSTSCILIQSDVAFIDHFRQTNNWRSKNWTEFKELCITEPTWLLHIQASSYQIFNYIISTLYNIDKFPGNIVNEVCIECYSFRYFLPENVVPYIIYSKSIAWIPKVFKLIKLSWLMYARLSLIYIRLFSNPA